MEILQALKSIPIMAVLTVPIFLAEIKGYSKLYSSLSDSPFPGHNYLQIPLFILFTDFGVYWIHRALHHPFFYKTLHKPHHQPITPTPFASYAFHPLDGFSQSLPYHAFPFIIPTHKFTHLALFTFINIWVVLIRGFSWPLGVFPVWLINDATRIDDGEYMANSPFINGTACHTIHHLYFNYNYGQFFTFWDRLGGIYRQPNEELFQRQNKMSHREWER
jgi:lathosterol oxidase